MPLSAENLTVKLPDGTPLELQAGATGADAALAIGEGLHRAALAIKGGEDIRDLSAPVRDGEEISISSSAPILARLPTGSSDQSTPVVVRFSPAPPGSIG